MTSGGNNFSYFAENQLTTFSAGDARDFNEAAGEREMAPKCGSLPRDAGDLAGLHMLITFTSYRPTLYFTLLFTRLGGSVMYW